MKKIILLSFVILFLSGCSIKYSASIDEIIEEEIMINEYVDRNVPAYIDEQGASETNEKIPGVDYYERANLGNITTYNYNFEFDNYTNSRAINTCLESVKLTNNNGEYILNTTGYYSCMDYYPVINDIEINLSFSDKYIITSNNADIVNGNILTWNINRSNYTDKYIQVVFKNDETYEDDENEPIIEEPIDDKNDFDNSFIIASLIFILFVAFISLLFYFKIKQSQRG